VVIADDFEELSASPQEDSASKVAAPPTRRALVARRRSATAKGFIEVDIPGPPSGRALSPWHHDGALG